MAASSPVSRASAPSRADDQYMDVEDFMRSVGIGHLSAFQLLTFFLLSSQFLSISLMDLQNFHYAAPSPSSLCLNVTTREPPFAYYAYDGFFSTSNASSDNETLVANQTTEIRTPVTRSDFSTQNVCDCSSIFESGLHNICALFPDQNYSRKTGFPNTSVVGGHRVPSSVALTGYRLCLLFW